MAYSPHQKRVAGKIVRRGRRRGETRKEIIAALQTGLVESNLRNIDYGDRDSVGWRQERGHYGSVAERMNLNRGIDRFYDETSAFNDGHGMTPGDLAAAVQRPAAEYRGRYAERGEEAKNLLRSFGGGKGGGGAAPKGGGSVFRVPIPGEMEVDEAGFEQALRQQKVATMLADDGAASGILSDLTFGGAKAPKVDGLDIGVGEDSSLFRSGLLSTDPVDPAAFQTPGPERSITVKGGKGGRGRGAARPNGAAATELRGLKIRKDGNKGAKMIAEWATRGGLYGSGERTPKQNAAVGGAEGSDHLTTRRDASAVDATYGSGATIAKRLGLGKKWRKGNYDRHIIRVDGRTFSVQILEDVQGHYDHTHLGVERV